MLESLFNKETPGQVFSSEFCKILINTFLQNTSGGCFWKIRVYSIHAGFTQGLLQLLFTFFDWKRSKWAYHLLQFFISYWEKFLKLIKFITQSHSSFEFFFIHKHVFCLPQWLFFRWLADESLLSRFSALINYIMWSYNLFPVSSSFPRFSWSWLFRVQVQGLGAGFGNSPTLVHIFSYGEEGKMWKYKQSS